MKSNEERIELLERSVKTYRILVLLLVLLLFVTQRQRVVGWIDSMERWAGAVTSAQTR